MSPHLMRLLGFAPLAGIDRLRVALAAVPGGGVRIETGTVAAVLQPEPQVRLVQRSKKSLLADLQTVQRRLEVACQAGPFLPMDPAAACCPARLVPALLAPAWVNLAAALARDGAHHQWDIILRWSPEAVVAQRRAEIVAAADAGGPAALADAVAAALRHERAVREKSLLAVLQPAVLALAPGGAAGTDAEIAITVLVPAAGEAAVEAALGRLEVAQFVGASLDLRGPLPPISFSPVRLGVTEPGEVASAWHRLGLDDRIDRAALHQVWRQRAAAAHPDRHPPAGQQAAALVLSDLTQAYQRLRDLVADDSGPVSLPDLLGRAGHRLIIPADPAPAPAMLEQVA